MSSRTWRDDCAPASAPSMGPPTSFAVVAAAAAAATVLPVRARAAAYVARAIRRGGAIISASSGSDSVSPARRLLGSDHAGPNQCSLSSQNFLERDSSYSGVKFL